MKNKQWLTLSLMFLFSITAFGLIFWITGTKISDFKQAFWQVGTTGLIMVISAMVGQLVIQALSWNLLFTKNNYKVTFKSSLSAIFMGWATNFLTPSMYLGGEPIRAYALTRYSNIPFHRSLGSVFVHKFLEFVTFMIFIILSTIFVFRYYKNILDKNIQFVITITILFLLVCLFTVILAIYFKKRCFSFLANFMIRCKLLVKFLQKHMTKIKEMETSILEAFYKSYFHTTLSLLLMILFDILIFIRPILFFAFLNKNLTLKELALLFLSTQLLQALQFTPGGIGILEGGTVGVLSLIGIAPAQAIGYATFCRIGDFLIVSIGISLAIYSMKIPDNLL